MARPTKTGLDYFPLDVDFFDDSKIRHIGAKFGSRGVLVTLQLLCRIYREGFYLDWSNDELAIFAKFQVNLPVKQVQAILNECLVRDFLDDDMFTDYSILTSRGIQKRFFEASKRRANQNLKTEYLLIDPSDYGGLGIVNVTETPVNSDLSTQSKVKESRTNEIIENRKKTFIYNIQLLNSQELISLSDELKIELNTLKEATVEFKDQMKLEYSSFVDVVQHFKEWYLNKHK